VTATNADNDEERLARSDAAAGNRKR